MIRNVEKNTYTDQKLLLVVQNSGSPSMDSSLSKSISDR